MTHPQALPQVNQFLAGGVFIHADHNGDGPFYRWWIQDRRISREVIQADIQRYLGPNAFCMPAGAGVGNNIYLISSVRNFTEEQLRDLRHDSSRWERERRSSSNPRGLREYIHSQIHRNRTILGPADRQPAPGQPAPMLPNEPIPQSPPVNVAPISGSQGNPVRGSTNAGPGRADPHVRWDSQQQASSGSPYSSPSQTQVAQNPMTGSRLNNFNAEVGHNLTQQVHQVSTPAYSYQPVSSTITSAPSTAIPGLNQGSYTSQNAHFVKQEHHASPSDRSATAQGDTSMEAEEESDDDDDEENATVGVTQSFSTVAAQYPSAYSSANYYTAGVPQAAPSAQVRQQPQVAAAAQTRLQPQTASPAQRAWLESQGYEFNPARNGTEYWLHPNGQLYFLSQTGNMVPR